MLEKVDRRIGQIGLEWMYAVAMLLAGTILVFLTPPYQVPDEPAHLARAYQISEGVFRSPIRQIGGELTLSVDVPLSLAKTEYVENLPTERKHYSTEKIWKDFSVPIGDERGTFANPTIGQYSPMAYLPQSTAAYLASTWGWTAGNVLYFMRWMTLLFVIGCVFYSLRLFPQQKPLLFLIAMMPMFMVEACSTAADAVINSVCLLGITYLLSLSSKGEAFSWRTLFLLALWAIVFGLLKPVYGVVLLLYFLIPASRMGGRGKFLLFGIVLLLSYFVTVFAWMHSISQGHQLSPLTGIGADIGGQIAFLYQQPWKFVSIFGATLAEHGAEQLMGMIGILGWAQALLPAWFYVFYGVMLLMECFSGSPMHNPPSYRIWMVGAVLLAILAIYLFCYLTWTPVGDSCVEGVQGRYLIPLLPMCLIALSGEQRCLHGNLIACVAGLVSVGVTVWKTVVYFY